MGKFTGKVAIVTASSDGIGLSIAERLATEGAAVMVSSRKQANVDKAVGDLRKKGLKVAGIVCHVAKPDHRTRLIEKTVAEFGGLDLLVSNAAVNPIFGPILNATEDAWEKIFDVNVKATFFLIKEAVPYMEKRGGGSVVIVSSQAGYSPSEMMGPYSISKTALLGMTKALVPQLSASNIRVNCIAPGVVITRFSEMLWKNEFSASVRDQVPLKRFARSEECAGVVSFLLSDDASYVTGETVTITGGMPNRL
ncbi:dehydrogenase/reductase SDR family member 4-like isoform X1 [Mya arenaria]|uniref:dehydrogenase/reductase SDR family member 4-like isoform X1 n=2 Tax=Mya arenaria TaxID=6604 RepID=UPI0022E87FE7|nr:dehydrogenase/reductase SDR family member 4-like isoform X1 [Mya arenaria]